VTETKPVMLIGSGIHRIVMPVLKKSLQESFEYYTFTYTQNAAWEILGVMPWLMQQPHENADQVFNRYFSASVAQHIFRNHPQIERVIKAWSAELSGDEDALSSAMERNPELKSAMLTATPWLTRAQTDTEQRRYFASLVEEGRLENEIYSAALLLQHMQLDNGAWPWFSGMWPSEKTTMDIVSEKKGIDTSLKSDEEIDTFRKGEENRLV